MKAPEQPKPNAPTEPLCTNPAWYALYATTEERLAYNARMEQARNEERYKRLMRDLDLLEDENFNNQ